MRIDRFLTTTALVSAVSFPAPGQQFTVDANDGSADFQSLEAAIVAVPSGSTLQLLSDMDEGNGSVALYVIDKSLQIVGDAGGGRPHIQDGVFWINPSMNSDVTVAMRNVESSGTFDWHCMEIYDNTTVILDQVRLEDKGIEHDTLRVQAGGFAILNDCELLARGHSGNINARALYVSGIAALKSCSIAMTNSPKWAVDVREDGVVYHTDTAVDGCVSQDTDADFVLLQSNSIESEPAVINDSLQLEGWFVPLQPGAVFIAFSVREPTDRQNPFFLKSGFLPLLFADGQWSLTLNVPDAVDLVGLTPYFQQLDLTTGRFSNVEARVIGL